MPEQLTPEARGVLLFAYMVARMSASQVIETEHVVLGMMRENPAFLNRFLTTKVSGDPLFEGIQRDPARHRDLSKLRDLPSPKRTDECERIIALAAEQAKGMGQEEVGIDHLLVAILAEENNAAARMLRERGADLDLIRLQLAAVPHEQPSKQQRKLKALNRMMNLLDTSHPSSGERIAQIRNQLQRGEDITDVSDQLMEIMADQARAERNPEGSGGISNRISEKVRRLVFFAQFEAGRSGASEVETGHLLLVILREQKNYLNLFMPLANSKEAVCAEIEDSLRVTQNTSRLEISPGATRPPLSEECRRAQTYAQEEASRLFSQRIGAEHLLLGLLREEGTFASRTLGKYGAELENIRAGLRASQESSSANSNGRLQ